MNETSNRRTVLIAFVAFIGLGLGNGLLGLAWPSMRAQFELPLDGVNVLFIVSTVTYSLAGFYIGRMMARFNSGTLLLFGAILMTLATFITASASVWNMVVLASVISGFGVGIIDAGLNLYMATYHTAQDMNFLHASFGIGVTVSPLIMTFALAQNWGWQVGYAIVGTLLITLIVLFAFTRKLWRNEGLRTADDKPVRRASYAETLRVPSVWFSMGIFLSYVGVEIGIGQWAYTLLTESRHVPTEIAGPWISIYWGAFTGGRILWGIIANRFDIGRVLRWSMLGTLAGAALFWWNPTPVIGFLGLLVVGFAEAPIFPMLMSSTARRVGVEHASNTIGMQMSAVGIGGAILPGLIGTIGKDFGLETMAATFVLMAVLVFIFHELTRLGHT